ncbi:uncharacterized protein TNCV_2579971 [Trichonephila clavipes]|uniref:Integrase zinc-binding domain-containing protein n=1 Tax=Trichonephila clavipes TaxID=2585209 RepID=A0A8X6SB32_TRICX|nr:uncharacterized protein TNCV_2579971 [Trichonephila clavipes]
MQTEIIKRAHDKGHFAVAKTEQIITLDYYFAKLTSKVQNVLANCVHCILVNRKRGKQEGFLNPIPKGELVAIKRTQFGTGLKLRPKFYGPYGIKTVKPHDRYEVEKVGQHEGPHLTSTAVDFMKRFAYNILIFFRCGQLIFRMDDCEVEGAIASPLSISPERAMSRTGERERRRKEHQNSTESVGTAREADAHRQSSNNS